MQESNALASLRVILETMDLPSERKKIRNISDLTWLGRNMHFRNKDHRYFIVAASQTYMLLKDNGFEHPLVVGFEREGSHE